MSTLHLFARIFENRAVFIFTGLIFRAALELSYVDFVHPFYEYAGFVIVANTGKYIESWILYIILLVSLPAQVHKPSDFLVGLAFFIFIAPLLVFYGLSDSARWVMYAVLLQYGILYVFRFGRSISLPSFRNGSVIALMFSLAGITMATTWMIAVGGLGNFNLDLRAAERFRDEANSIIYNGVLGYIVVWATTVCAPFILMLTLRDKRRILAFCIIVLHVFWFGLTSHKAVLFYPALVVVLYLFFKYSRALSAIPLGLSFVVIGSLISYYLTEGLLLGSLFVRRLLFVPSHLTFTYFEFFENNPLVYWSNSFLSGLVRYPYDESTALVIGDYLNTPTQWANNSFFSTGYMHAGMYGVVLYGFVVGVLLKILDSLAKSCVPLWMALSVVIVPFFNLFKSSDLPTTLLTHGLGFGILILYLMGRRADVRKGEIALSLPNSDRSAGGYSS